MKNHAVENGKEAVDIHCSGQSFDLILMDSDMPIMNGIEVRNYLIIGYEVESIILLNLIYCTFDFQVP